MALNGATIFEIRNVADFAGAADTNGGGFSATGNTGTTGTDYSFASINANGSAKYALTNGQTQGTAIILTASASADMIGNIAYITGGTGAVVAAWYQIINASVGVSITVDRTTGLTAGTGTTINIGGALASPGAWGGAMAGTSAATTGIRAWMKYSATAYSMTVATSNVSGGILTMAGGFGVILEGYDQTRGDRTGNRPEVSWASVAAPGGITYIFNALGTSGQQRFANLSANGNSVNNVGGFAINTLRCLALQCVARNCNGTAGVGFLGLTGNIGAMSCTANTCTTGFSAGSVICCYATACTNGFSNTQMNVKCLAYANTSTGFVAGTPGSVFKQCTSDSNTTAGFSASQVATYVDCISSNHSSAGTGFLSTIASGVSMHNNASYNNTTEVTTGANAPLVNEGMILNASFTGGQPYTVAGSDFRPNATAGSGALLRDTGIGVQGQTDGVDIGAVQHTDPVGGGGGGGMVVVARGEMMFLD